MSSLTTRLDNLERQICLNADFSLWQRGVGPVTPTSSYTFLADRFSGLQSGYSATMQRSTDVPTLAQSGYQSVYSLLVTNATGASPTSGQWQALSYKIEGQDYQRIHGKMVRKQFWVKSSVAGTYVLALRNAATTRAYVTTYTIPSANTWIKVPLDILLDSAGTWAFDNSVGLEILWTLTSGSSFQTGTLGSWQTTAGTIWGATGQTQWGATTGATFRIAQVSCIPGDFTLAGASNVDIPFQRAGRTIQQEIAMAQRYYEKSYDLSVAPATATGTNTTLIGTGVSLSILNTLDVARQAFTVRKRAAPTVAVYSLNGTANTLSNHSAGSDLASGSGTPVVVGEANFEIRNSSGSTLSVSNGLEWHWTADAEL